MHREIKQLTGSEKCQCRKQRTQHNHWTCYYQAWLALRVHAQSFAKSIYVAKHDVLADFLRAELRNPRISAL